GDGRHPGHGRGQVPRPEPDRAGARRPPGGDRPGRRDQRRAEPGRAAGQAGNHPRRRAARPSTGAEGGHRRRHRGARLAADRGRDGPASDRPGAAAGRRGRGTPGGAGKQAYRKGGTGHRMNDGELYEQVSRYLGQEMAMTSADADVPDGDDPAQRPGEASQIVVVGPDGRPTDADQPERAEDDLMAQVEQPAKVMRIGTMIKQLLEEVRAAPLDEAGRVRLREIHQSSIKELEEGLSADLREELDRLTLPFDEDSVPSEAELRIAQAQLVGWLEGLFHGIQTALFAQQMAARAQL